MTDITGTLYQGQCFSFEEAHMTNNTAEVIPRSETMRIKKSVVGRNGKRFRSAKKAINFCQEDTIGQTMKMWDSFWEGTYDKG